ncbi:hypothetical protein [Trichothermofontia sp.]
MHDGSIATLAEVLAHYAAGGRTLHRGDYAGVGRDSPLKSSFVQGFTLSTTGQVEHTEGTQMTFLAGIKP